MGDELGPRDQGFSLIELLVVVAILAVLAVGASITALRGGAGRDDLLTFETQVILAQRMAVQSRQSRGIYVDQDSLRMAQRVGDDWQADSAIATVGRLAFSRSVDVARQGAPDIVVHPNGQLTVFNIQFASGRRCASDGWVLTCGR